MRVVKVNSSQGSLGKNEGCEKAPNLICDKGESVKVVRNNIEKTNENIYNFVNIMDVIIGGDHSITYSCFKKFSKYFKNPGLLIFDAHPDCMHNFKPPSHEDFVRVLIEEGLVKKENVILVGLRQCDKLEKEFLDKNKIKCYYMDKLEDIEDMCDGIMEICKDFDGVYLSIDIDVVDPAFAPGTGYIEPEGLSTRELFYFLRRLMKLGNIKMIDLVEINPEKDINYMTLNIGKKILKEVMDE